jgi:hypothetical protein
MTLDLKYPLGIQTFSKIIEDQLLYVNKTGIVGELLRGGSVYFLSRPCRFGKSLLISTLDALFSGRKPCLRAWLLPIQIMILPLIR